MGVGVSALRRRRAFDYLDAPPMRVHQEDVPMPYTTPTWSPGPAVRRKIVRRQTGGLVEEPRRFLPLFAGRSGVVFEPGTPVVDLLLRALLRGFCTRHGARTTSDARQPGNLSPRPVSVTPPVRPQTGDAILCECGVYGPRCLADGGCWTTLTCGGRRALDAFAGPRRRASCQTPRPTRRSWPGERVDVTIPSKHAERLRP